MPATQNPQPAVAEPAANQPETNQPEAAQPVQAEAVPVHAQPVTAPPSAPPAAAEHAAIPRRMRFVWSSDAEGRITGLSPEFMALMRLDAEDEMIGRAWSELIGPRLRDTTGALLAGLASGQTFSDASVLFRIGQGNSAINTTLSGSPVFDASRTFQGYRGFGALKQAPAAPPQPVANVAPQNVAPQNVAPQNVVAQEAVPQAEQAPPAPHDEPTELAQQPSVPEPALVSAPVAVAEPASAMPIAAPPTPRGLAALFPSAPIRARKHAGERGEEPATTQPSEEAEHQHQEAVPVPAMPAAADDEEIRASASDPGLEPDQDAQDEQPPEELADERGAEAEDEDDSEDEALAEAGPQTAPQPGPEPQPPEAVSLKPEPAGNDDEPPRLPAVATLQTRLPDMLRNAPAAAAGMVGPQPPQTHALRPVLAPAKADLSASEKQAFRQIAEALGAQMDDANPQLTSPQLISPQQSTPMPGSPKPPSTPSLPPVGILPPRAPQSPDIHAELLDKLPIGVLVSRNAEAAYANRTFLDLLGYDDLADIARHGGMENLFRGRAPDEGGGAVLLVAKDGDLETVEARLSAIAWQGRPATLMSFRRAIDADAPARARALELDLDVSKKRMAELSAILDTATDGVVTLDERGRILSLNGAAEALFGYDQREVTGEIATILFAPESHAPAMDYLDGLKGGGVASVLNDGREVVGMVRQGGRVPLFMTMGRIAEGQDTKFCAVLRDITAWKKAEGELTEARKTAEQASAQKSDVLAKISHEIRTPLNAIIGFSEVMAEERFGPMGSERYKEYARDIRESGSYLISLVNDLLDLAKIEAGRLDLDFESVNLNDIANAAVSLLQPEAARNRVVLRTGLSTRLPPVVADERSLRQIVINLLSNAVKFTDSGGQVIVSTALGDKGEAILRVRDTGIGMTPDQLKLALEPFRQVSATRRGGGTGLGLPLTKALVEANRGAFQISSVPKEGTLAEVVFPPQRVLAG
ncbi:MAG: ATP-binding protein [Bosea sp. (in: a-proteobacteria)]